MKKNIVYECTRFNMCKQEANETVDAFVTALFALAEHCNYGTLHDELIRDRIVVGLADTRLSERMQMEKDLDLDKAINMARQSEEIKKQQTLLRSDASGVKQVDQNSEDRVFKGRHQKEKPKLTKTKSYRDKHKINNKSSQCNKCGGTPHPRHECAANEAKCHSCGKKGHYQRVCHMGKAVQSTEEEENFFLGTVTSDDDKWTAVIDVMDKNITFKLDTGADVTAVSQTEFKNIFSNYKQPVPQNAGRPLFGPGWVPLDVSGFANLQAVQRAG